MSKFIIKQIPIGTALRLSMTLVDCAEVVGVELVNRNPHLIVQEPVISGETPPTMCERSFVMLAVGREYEPAAGETLRRRACFCVPDSALVLVLYEAIAEKKK